MVRTLVLGEPPLMQWLNALPDGPPLVTDFIDTAITPCEEAFAREESRLAVRTFIDAVIGEGAFDQIPSEIQVAIMDNAAEFRQGVETPFETMNPPFFCEDAANVRVPALLVGGELSLPMFGRVLDELARCLPIVEQATIPGVSHDLWNLPVLTETVLGFLARH